MSDFLFGKRQAFIIIRINIVGSVAKNLTQYRQVGNNDVFAPAANRLNGRNTKAFIETWEDQGATTLVQISQVSIFELVTDPWLPAVYTGIYMLLAGAFCMLIFGVRKS